MAETLTLVVGQEIVFIHGEKSYRGTLGIEEDKFYLKLGNTEPGEPDKIEIHATVSPVKITTLTEEEWAYWGTLCDDTEGQFQLLANISCWSRMQEKFPRLKDFVGGKYDNV